MECASEELASPKETLDPDYARTSTEQSQKQVRLSLEQQDAKEHTINKIEDIIQEQFALEMHLKQSEVKLIDHRISQTKAMLDRLRACILARYYGTSERMLACDFPRTRRSQRQRDSTLGRIVSGESFPLTEHFQGVTEASIVKDNVSLLPESSTEKNDSEQAACTSVAVSGPCMQGSESPIARPSQSEHSKQENSQSQGSSPVLITQGHSSSLPGKQNITFDGAPTTQVAGSRFYVKKRIIIGNTSKYIPMERREENDKSTHKWMVYVRGMPEDLPIHYYVKKVWFFLHPSYRPNDIVEVKKPPFQLTRRGWGEFPIRVQLHFVDARNKRVDIIHELRLDKTYTGLQTMGAETVVDLEMEKKTFEDLGLPIPMGQYAMPSTPGISKPKHVSSASKSEVEIEADRVASLSEAQLVIEQSTEELPPSQTSTPPSSCPVSRCTSPIIQTEALSSELEGHLHQTAGKHALIQTQRNFAKFPYCVQSIGQFLEWNLYKRRAAEWQRALHIKKYLQKSGTSCELTTKEIMIWCRQHGYTPTPSLPKDDSQSYCKICGTVLSHIEHSDTDDEEGIHRKCHRVTKSGINSYTTSDDFFVDLEKEENICTVELKGNDEQNVDVDVIGIPPTLGLPYPTVKPQTQNLTTPLTAEQQWIKDICNDIGIALRPVIIEGAEMHAVEGSLFAIAQHFIADLMRTALALSANPHSTLEPRVMVPYMVYKALNVAPCWDILTNVHLGHLVTGTNNVNDA